MIWVVGIVALVIIGALIGVGLVLLADAYEQGYRDGKEGRPRR